MRPYLQGDLDGLCGLYSLINAARLVNGPMGRARSQSLLQACLVTLKGKADLSDLVSSGMGVHQVLHAFRHAIQPNLPLGYHRPFAKVSRVPLKRYWRTVEAFLNGGQNRAAIVCIESGSYNHWTLVRAMSGRQMLLFDSDGARRVYRRLCTTSENNTRRPVLLSPTLTIFFRRVQTEEGEGHD